VKYWSRKLGSAYDEPSMRVITAILSMFGTGAVVLYVAFSAIAGVSPAEAAAASSAVAAIAALCFLRAVRLEYDLRSQGGDPDIRTAYNRQRERRGF
jgi:hypothetical protein